MPTTNNKNLKKDKPQPSHLDKLLENKPPEFQAKVLRFALDSEMKEDDPAFRLVQYIGYLSQLTETAPSEWKQLFKKLQGELSEWTELTAEQLATAADQSEAHDNLAQSCNRLGIALNALDLTSQQQLQQLTTLSEISPSLKNVAQEIPTLKKLLTNLNQTLSHSQTLTLELSPSQMAQLKREIALEIESRNLTSMLREMLDLAQNQRRMMGMLEQLTQKKRRNINPPGILARIWERYATGILTWICRLDWQFIWVVAMILAFIAVPVALVMRMNGDYQPITSLEIVDKQVRDTYMQVNNANVRLQRIEKHLGTQPKSKGKEK
ncbi:DUF6753 family protein [Brunnivagina elsteri]|uniref:Uncharacterized protein n=1 Tax=Brunnivagina elsteri CCALA 953 TaxID=987040 RepID=A0A2A2TGR9_9CYAN|nr:DUF6753 family protein [Calothrix elsteri]PAX52922.1 hypothetical protein CK510_16705 [Calothrix elsteri CCALA 953]